MSRLLFYRDASAGSIELGYAIALGVVDAVAENVSLVTLLDTVSCLIELLFKARSMEDIVAEDEAYRIIAYEVGSDDESLRQTFGTWLNGIAHLYTEGMAVAQKAYEAGDIVGRGDEEDVADAGLHEHRQRIIYHRLVVDWQELFGDTLCDRI